MKIIKIGQINFYKDKKNDHGIFRCNAIIEYLNKYTNNKYEYHNCITDSCDIVFYSLYDHLVNLKKVKGNPLFIYWPDEYLACGADGVKDPFNYYKGKNLSLSFYDDNDTNLFFPYFLLFIYFYNFYDFKEYKNKYKFCTFCASNMFNYNAQYRTKLVKYISQNYKEITCCGKVLNNTNNKYLSYNIDKAIKYHNPYKFNICFENYYTDKNITYITEKIIFAYMYNTVPIYWGAKRVTEWFNKESFINCNDLSFSQILYKIKQVDNNNELLYYMLNQYPFVENVNNIREYFILKLNKFIMNNL